MELRCFQEEAGGNIEKPYAEAWWLRAQEAHQRLLVATGAMSTVLAHNLQPSPPSDREVATTRHLFCRYLLRLPMSPALRGKRGCGIHAASTGQNHWFHDLVCHSVWCGARFSTHSVQYFPLTDNPTSQPLPGPPSSSSPPPPM
ncbi:hypothetical protein M9H77_18267 [Catharanthus roseus]|uniref:Uncharacterized protein n=1 Tax=Catharanthus roseus TaxID=4058 RepID=A0ACC0B6Y5_CATRO|nr:hypothetical protein M9H77_18267 [Catharanthus roseus]